MNRAGRGLRARMAEILTLQRLKLPLSLYSCPATASLIEGSRSAMARVPSVFRLLLSISSALDHHSIRCYLNGKIYFSITEV